MKFLTDFTYRNLHGFARFPGDSTALVIQYTSCEGCTDYGIAVASAYTRYSIGRLSRVKRVTGRPML